MEPVLRQRLRHQPQSLSPRSRTHLRDNLIPVVVDPVLCVLCVFLCALCVKSGLRKS